MWVFRLYFDFKVDTKSEFRLNAIQNIGQLATIPFAAYACDRFGRKAVLMASAFILLIGVALQAAAQNSEYTLHYNLV